jgi:catalase
MRVGCRVQDYRHMNGSSVHTYTLVNASNAATFVKFHWVPTVGARPLGLFVTGIRLGCLYRPPL